MSVSALAEGKNVEEALKEGYRPVNRPNSQVSIGYVPIGYPVKKIDPLTGEFTYEQPRATNSIDPLTGEYVYEPEGKLNRVAKALQGVLDQEREKEKRQTEKFQKQAEMYKALIDAGYDPKRAHEAASKMRFPEEPPES